jgi:hypothetical protein
MTIDVEDEPVMPWDRIRWRLREWREKKAG